MALVQTTPFEVRELDLNAFRLTLRALESSEEGIIFDRTHLHNTEINLGEYNQARFVGIINDYTVTFESGQYAVNLVGANSNVSEVINLNQVSIRSFNSTGLISISSSSSGGLPEAFANVAYDTEAEEVKGEAWLERSGVRVDESALIECNLIILDSTGTEVFDEASAEPDALGRFIFSAPATIITDRVYTMVVTIEDSIGIVETAHSFSTGG
jgi:hypothetical protein